MALRLFVGVAIALGATLGADAAPFLPKSDSEIVERLPYTANDPAIRQLNAIRAELKQQPDNLPLALSLAQGYADLGRSTGDLRYVGYAQAALAPWWDDAAPPPQVLLLRAALRQRLHRFDAALIDLASILNLEPGNAQAQLMRATVLQVTGDFSGARDACDALRRLTKELVWTACLASVNGATGHLRDNYERLRITLERAGQSQPAIRSWALTGLAEMAARAGLAGEADRHFRAALSLDPNDGYLLAAYADFLLSEGRPRDAAALVKDHTRNDPLLLRFAMALQAMQSPEATSRIAELRDRFEASHLRGDKVHLREEAVFTLHLLGDPQSALKLAVENWSAQKELADIRILLEAGLAAQDPAATDAAKAWLAAVGMEDIQIDKLLSAAMKPQ